MFSKKGLITVRTDAIDENELMEIALTAGADDMETVGEVYELTCEPGAYEELKGTLVDKEIPTEVAEISMVPQSTIAVNKLETAKKILALMEEFEDHEDVQNVYANFDIPDEIINQLEG
jgi:transcriptional/translational regulatory protein YebC/TACO1